MSKPQSTIIDLEILAEDGAQAEAIPTRNGARVTYGNGLDAGGILKLAVETTSIDVIVMDAYGKVLYDGTVTETTTVAPTAQGLTGPLLVFTENGVGTNPRVLVNWKIKK